MLADLRAAQAEAGQALDALVSVEDAARLAEREAMLAGYERLLASVQRLDRCASLKDTLETLGSCVAAEAARSLVFVVRGDTLQVLAHQGLAGAVDQAPLTLVSGDTGALGEAIARGRTVPVDAAAFGEELNPALPFVRAAGSATGLAVPITLDSRTVALVYADNGDCGTRGPTTWPRAVQVFACHASRVLEALIARRSAGLGGPVGRPAEAFPATVDHHVVPEVVVAEPGSGNARSSTQDEQWRAASRYAHLLISEIKLYRQPDIRAGCEQRDLRVRLGAEIDRARESFHERVPAGVAWRDTVFDEEVVRTLAEGDAEALGPSAAEPV